LGQLVIYHGIRLGDLEFKKKN